MIFQLIFPPKRTPATSSIKAFVCKNVTSQPWENAPCESLQITLRYFCDNDCQGKKKCHVTTAAFWSALKRSFIIIRLFTNYRDPTEGRQEFPTSAYEEVAFPEFYSQFFVYFLESGVALHIFTSPHVKISHVVTRNVCSETQLGAEQQTGPSPSSDARGATILLTLASVILI